GTGNDHGELNAGLRVELLGAVFAGHSQRLLRSTEGSLSVGKDGNQTWATLHATSSAQLRAGFLPLSSVVGGDAVGFSGYCHAASTVLGGTRVLEGLFDVLVEKGGGHDEVLGDNVRVIARQAAQLLAHLWIEVLRIHALRDARLPHPGVDALLAVARALRPRLTCSVRLATTVPEVPAPPVAAVATVPVELLAPTVRATAATTSAWLLPVTVVVPAIATVIAVPVRVVSTAVVTVEFTAAVVPSAVITVPVAGTSAALPAVKVTVTVVSATVVVGVTVPAGLEVSVSLVAGTVTSIAAALVFRH